MTLGAPTDRASGGDSRAGVPKASASARAPLAENGFGYGNSATSAAENQRATSASGTQPVNRAASPNRRRQVGREPARVVAQPRMLAARHDDVDVGSDVPARLEDELDALVRGDEAEAERHEPIAQIECGAGGITIERGRDLDPVRDDGGRRDRARERCLVDDGRLTRPHHGTLQRRDARSGQRRRRRNTVETGVPPVDGGGVDDLVHGRHEARAETPASPAERRTESEQRGCAPVQEQLELQVRDRRLRLVRGSDRRGQRPRSEREASPNLDVAVVERRRIALELAARRRPRASRRGSTHGPGSPCTRRRRCALRAARLAADRERRV